MHIQNICITESLCCIPKINTTLLINYTPVKCFFKKESSRSLIKMAPVQTVETC